MVNFKALTLSVKTPVQTSTDYGPPIPTFSVVFQAQPLLFGFTTSFHEIL